MTIQVKLRTTSILLCILFSSLYFPPLRAYESEQITFESRERQNWVSKFFGRESGHRTQVTSLERGILGSVYSGKRGAKIRYNFNTKYITENRDGFSDSYARGRVKMLSAIQLSHEAIAELGQPLMGAVTTLNGAYYALLWLNKTSSDNFSTTTSASPTDETGLTPATDEGLRDGDARGQIQEGANLRRTEIGVQISSDSVERYLRHRPASGALLQLGGQGISFNFSNGKFGGLHLPQIPDSAVLLRIDREETSVLKVYHFTKRPLLGVAVVESIYDFLYDLAFADLQELLARNPTIRFRCDRNLKRDE